MSLRTELTVSPAVLRQSAPVFAALGDETRLRLLSLLCDDGARSIAQLTARTVITRQGVTKHLRVLAKAGLIRNVKAGRKRLWECDAEQLGRARRSLNLVASLWEQAPAPG